MERVRTDRKSIDGNRLTFLRELNGMTVKEVAEELNVTSSYVSQMEHNKKNIDFNSIIKLSKVFGVSKKFILNEDPLPKLSKTMFYRKKSVVTKKKQVQASRKACLFSYLEEQVSLSFGLNYFTLPEYANFEEKFKMLNFRFIDSVANKVRKEFSFGNGPISNMTLLVEKMGIRISFVNLEDQGIDAITVKSEGRFYILINSNTSSSVRIRFNIAHELGHILLHSKYSEIDVNNSSNHKRIEAEANHFASALLMPEDGIAADMYSTNMEHLKQLKKHWLVSIQALIYRGNELDLITDKQALFLRQTISRNHWRYTEPYDDTISIEWPTFLASAFKFLNTDEKQYIEEISYRTGIFDEQICRYFDLNESELHREDSAYHGLHIVR